MTRDYLFGIMFGITISVGFGLAFFCGGIVMMEHLLDRNPGHRLEVLK